MQLVIAEKPSVARSIAGMIGATEKHNGHLQGNGYLVMVYRASGVLC